MVFLNKYIWAAWRERNGYSDAAMEREGYRLSKPLPRGGNIWLDEASQITGAIWSKEKAE